jgi:hypothetical protein
VGRLSNQVVFAEVTVGKFEVDYLDNTPTACATEMSRLTSPQRQRIGLHVYSLPGMCIRDGNEAELPITTGSADVTGSNLTYITPCYL